MKVQHSDSKKNQSRIIQKIKKYRAESVERMLRSLSAQPFDTCRMGKLVAWISAFSVLFGLAMAAFFLALRHCLMTLIFGSSSQITNMGRSYSLMSAYAWYLFFSGVVLLVLCLLFWRKGKLCLNVFLQAYPEAMRYYKQSIAVSRRKVVFSLLLLTAGLLSGICAGLLLQADLYYILPFCAVMAAAGVYGIAVLFYKWQAGRTLKVCCVEDTEQRDSYSRRKEIKREIVKWSVYWLFVLAGYLAISFVFKSLTMYALYLVLAAINCIIRLMINSPFRRFSGLRAKRITIRLGRLLSTCALVYGYFLFIGDGSRYNELYIGSLDYGVFQHNSSFAYDGSTGVYTVSGTREEFRILQLTDLHICASITTIGTDRKAFCACYELIKETQPDLIILTGDLIYPIPIQTFSKNNLNAIGQVCVFMNNIGIPWTMVYGNHDTETVAAYSAKELSGLFRHYRNSGEPMLYAEIQPEVYGRYNQYIRIENQDGSLNRLVFLVDSNDYVKGSNKANEYDSVHQDQIQWYRDTIDKVAEEEGRLVPSFVFMHIPFRAFRTAQEALKSGSPDAEYLFGENGEGVSCPDRDSGFFDAILEKQSTEAVFVGHDHLNYMGVRYKGVDLVYSKSIDYYAYPGIAEQTAQRGATLIRLFPDGSYRIEQADYVPEDVR